MHLEVSSQRLGLRAQSDVATRIGQSNRLGGQRKGGCTLTSVSPEHPRVLLQQLHREQSISRGDPGHAVRCPGQLAQRCVEVVNTFLQRALAPDIHGSPPQRLRALTTGRSRLHQVPHHRARPNDVTGIAQGVNQKQSPPKQSGRFRAVSQSKRALSKWDGAERTPAATRS
jgi:hypothetical protein